MAGPRGGGGRPSTSGSKVPRLPKAKKKNRTQVDAFGEAAGSTEAGPSGNTRGNGNGNGNSGGKKNNPSKKSKRSFLGFLVSAASCAAVWGWSIFNEIVKRDSDRRILDYMRQRPLRITEHASCRMDCRFVTRTQIESTLRWGRINSRKSEPTMRPCPKYVVDAEIDAGGRLKEVQSVFAACPNETRVITVIDTKTNWPCGAC